MSGVTSGNIIDNEFWVYTNNSPQAWVETGQTRGVVSGVWRDYGLFWAEVDTNGTYSEHFERTFTLGEVVTQKIAYSGSGSWAVYVNGTVNGYSSSNHGTQLVEVDGGLESSTGSAALTGTIDNIQKEGSAGTWSSGWPGSISVDSPLDFGWSTPYWEAYDSEN